MKNIKSYYALIMAGGEGTRFAPYSTPEKPKQFLNFVGDGTFVQQTCSRISSLIKPDHIYIATNERYFNLVREQLLNLPIENIILEPVKKNTAPCIAYCSKLIYERDPNAVIVVLPSDHVIINEDEFLKVLTNGMEWAENHDELITLGIKPTWPSTDYGYIKTNSSSSINQICKVESFVEKPSAMTAQEYIKSGKYSWNGGIFIWKAKTILEEIKLNLKDIYNLLLRFEPTTDYLKDFFHKTPSVSIDYGVLEKSKRVAVIPSDFGWSDVGTWEGLYRLYKNGSAKISPVILNKMHDVLGYVGADNSMPCPRKIEKPWGHEEIWVHTNDYVGKVLVINSPHRLSYQYHNMKEETIRVPDGIMDIEFESNGTRKTIRLNPGDIFHIPPKTKHRMISVENCRILEVSTPFLNDIVRVEDDYGR